ncbi:hypothetical protein [Streptomyces sp. NPDC093149]|uniref:hypothetical protein n=1 Tax=Streptomyces sp. NPDC093149 TaxID=3366031 RepID=UPI0037F87005
MSVFRVGVAERRHDRIRTLPVGHTSNSPEKSVVLTKLDEAVTWANIDIARRQDKLPVRDLELAAGSCE